MPFAARSVLSLVVSPLLAVAAIAQTAAPRPKLGDKVAQTIDGRFDEAVKFRVAKETAVRVAVAPNKYDVAEFLVLPAADGSMWFDYGYGPTSKAARVSGSLEQIGNAPCAAFVQWERTGDEWNVELRLTADRAAITAAADEIRAGRRPWSMWLRNSTLLASPDLGETERLAGFVRLWSEVKYNFVFFDRRPELDWDRVLVDYLPRVQRAAQAAAYYRVLREMMALLHDGHSEAWGPDDEPTAAPPIALGEIEGKAIVVGIRKPDAIPNEARRHELETAHLTLGDEVTAIDGEAVADVLQRRIHPFVCASTPQHRALLSYPLLLRGEPGTIARLTVRAPDGATRDVALTRGYLAAYRSDVRHTDGEIEPGIVYVALPSFAQDDSVASFEKLLPAIRGANGLVLDVRTNGGGNTTVGNRVIAALTDKRLPGSKWRTRLYRPAFRAWDMPEGWHEGTHEDVVPRSNPFLGPVVVLTGPRTFSAAEDFLVVLKASGRALLVGERTGGSTGQPLQIKDLPGGGGARVCTKRDTFPDGTEFVGVGVIPDVEVAPTVADVAAGKDPVFERGLAELRQRITK